MPIIHIVGLFNEYKDIFKEKYETERIYDLEELENILKTSNPTNYKELLKKEIKNIIKNAKREVHSKIFIIGNNIIGKVFFNLSGDLNIYIKNDINEIVKLEIKNILDTKYNDIINGNFDLNNINYNKLIMKKKIQAELYVKNGYKIESYDKIYKLVDKMRIVEIPNVLYIIHSDKFINKINTKKNIYAYTDQWLALASIYGSDIEKGYTKTKKPYIKVNQNIINDHKKTYLYEINDTQDFNPIVTNGVIYKYVINKSVTFSNMSRIDNVIDTLKKMDVKIYK